MIGRENSCHTPNQSKVKGTPIMTWSPAFSRALDSLLFFFFFFQFEFLSADMRQTFVLIGCFDYFGFFDSRLKTNL